MWLLWLLVLLASPALAYDVDLAWDHSVSPQVTGYEVHWGTSPPITVTTP